MTRLAPKRWKHSTARHDEQGVAVDLGAGDVIHQVGLEKNRFARYLQAKQFQAIPQQAREFLRILGRRQNCHARARRPVVVIVARHEKRQGGQRRPQCRASLQLRRGGSYDHLERISGRRAIKRQGDNSQGRRVEFFARLYEYLQTMLHWGYGLVVSIEC